MISYSAACLKISISDIKVCGDDNLIITDDKLDADKLTNHMNRTFGVNNKILVADVAAPNTDYLGSFLGSRWLDKSGPQRNVIRMSLGAIGVKNK